MLFDISRAYHCENLYLLTTQKSFIMNIFIFLFAGAMVLTFIAISPRKVRSSAQYPQGYYDMGRVSQMTERSMDQKPGTLTILMYTIIFVSGLLVAMSALA